jgi:pseudouridine-5'-phosphate glycosidase
MYEQFIDMNDEVKEAKADKKPIVALESTIISHGMPYPENVETAISLEDIIRKNGAIPATIAIINGRIKIGLSKDEIEFLGKEKGIVKVSRRDMPFVIAKKLNGAATVASTMISASLAGIKIFATGGIGGVHRGAQETFDISADLVELSKTNVGVICAGAKSILDIGLTLEVLETLGVPTVGYKTSEFPAFYTRSSGHKVDYRCDSPDEIARALYTKWSLNINGGAVIANPVPAYYEMDNGKINNAIEEAISVCNAKGIKGKEVTPFLLSKIKDITGGESLKTNISLVKNNAALAAKIAVCFSKL